MSLGVETIGGSYVKGAIPSWSWWVDRNERRFNAGLANRGMTRYQNDDQRWVEMRLDLAQEEADYYRQLILPSFERWKIDPSGYFTRGLTIGEFTNTRIGAMFGWLGEIDHEWKSWFPLTDDPLISSFLDELLRWGVIVDSEIRYLNNRLGGSWMDVENILRVEYVNDYISNTPTCKAKIVSWGEALWRMKRCRDRGNRVVVSMGHFDVGTRGHRDALGDFTWATQHGELFVFVDGDRETAVSKGDPRRPYLPQVERMKLVAQHRGVKWVVPVNFDNFTTRDELAQCFIGLQQELSGLAHIRIIGSREPKDHQYLRQAAECGLLFVYSDRPKVTSATKEGEKLKAIIR